MTDRILYMPPYSTALSPYESFFYCILGSYFRDWTDFCPLAVSLWISNCPVCCYFFDLSTLPLKYIRKCSYGNHWHHLWSVLRTSEQKKLKSISWHFFSLINSLSRFNLGTRLFRKYNFNSGKIYFLCKWMIILTIRKLD